MRIEGCIVFTFDTGTITAIQEKYPMAELYLYYNNGNQVYPEKDSMLLKDLQQEDAGRKLRSYIQIQSVEDYIVATRLDKHTAASIPVVHILAILAIGAVLVIAGEILISSYLKRLTKRLDGIIQGMDQVQTGNLKVQLPENENGDELDMISRHFNLMCQELESYIQKAIWQR
ncbi:MAG: HAMP domain-containing protein [Blautia marasmi]